MITNWLKSRAQRKRDEAERRAQYAKEMEQLLIARGHELKAVLIDSGIQAFSRINRNLPDEYVSMYGVLEKRLVEATMTAKGAFLIKYV